jgi:hypothetical protein
LQFVFTDGETFLHDERRNFRGQFGDLALPEQQKAPIRFTFLWVENDRWEGKDYVVEVKQMPARAAGNAEHASTVI